MLISCSFFSLDELAKDGHNGRIFDNSVQLADLFEVRFTAFFLLPFLIMGQTLLTSFLDSPELTTLSLHSLRLEPALGMGHLGGKLRQDRLTTRRDMIIPPHVQYNVIASSNCDTK